MNVTVLTNGTISGGTGGHIGQLFWDQSHITQVEATSPYSSNRVTLTTNAEDPVFSDEAADTTSDLVLNYVWLGDSLSDGLLGSTTVAVDTLSPMIPTIASYTPPVADLLSLTVALTMCPGGLGAHLALTPLVA